MLVRLLWREFKLASSEVDVKMGVVSSEERPLESPSREVELKTALVVEARWWTYTGLKDGELMGEQTLLGQGVPSSSKLMSEIAVETTEQGDCMPSIVQGFRGSHASGIVSSDAAGRNISNEPLVEWHLRCACSLCRVVGCSNEGMLVRIARW